MTETVLLLQNNWTLRSDAGDNVRICEPDGTERLYWDSNEWHEDPIGVMGAIFGAAATLPVTPPACRLCGEHFELDPDGSPGVLVHNRALGDQAFDLDEDHVPVPEEDYGDV